jgi:hypothetical protein
LVDRSLARPPRLRTRPPEPSPGRRRRGRA